MSFAYDVDGIRTAKTVAGTLTKFVVDKNRDYAQVLEELSAVNAALIAYVYGDDLLSQVNTQVAAAQQVHIYHFDGHMSTRQLTNNAGQETDFHQYDAFGNTLAQTGSTSNAYLYASEQRDSALGFYYLRDRYLDHPIGRFVSPDRFQGLDQDPKTLHRYIYAAVAPSQFRDPSGLLASVAEVNVTVGIMVAAYAFFGWTLLQAVALARLMAQGLEAATEVLKKTSQLKLKPIFAIDTNVALRVQQGPNYDHLLYWFITGLRRAGVTFHISNHAWNEFFANGGRAPTLGTVFNITAPGQAQYVVPDFGSWAAAFSSTYGLNAATDAVVAADALLSGLRFPGVVALGLPLLTQDSDFLPSPVSEPIRTMQVQVGPEYGYLAVIAAPGYRWFVNPWAR